MWWLYDAYRFQWDDTKGTFWGNLLHSVASSSSIRPFFLLISCFHVVLRSRRQKGKSVSRTEREGTRLPHTHQWAERDLESRFRRDSSGFWITRRKECREPSLFGHQIALNPFAWSALSRAPLQAVCHLPSGGSVRSEVKKITAISRRVSKPEPGQNLPIRPHDLLNKLRANQRFQSLDWLDVPLSLLSRFNFQLNQARGERTKI
jgi:hypothetical protein